MKKQYIVGGAIVVIILIVLILIPSPTKQSSEEATIHACIESGGVYEVTTHTCKTKPATTPPTAPNPTVKPPIVAPPVETVNDLIRVTTPIRNSVVTPPFRVSGEARGNWYFEASFPIILKNSEGVIIASTNAHATANWMTEKFVPFEASLTFNKQVSGSSGTLILKNDNPSGDPEKDKSIVIPVKFK